MMFRSALPSRLLIVLCVSLLIGAVMFWQKNNSSENLVGQTAVSCPLAAPEPAGDTQTLVSTALQSAAGIVIKAHENNVFECPAGLSFVTVLGSSLLEQCNRFWVYEYSGNEQARTNANTSPVFNGKFYISGAELSLQQGRANAAGASDAQKDFYTWLDDYNTLQIFMSGKMYYMMSEIDMEFSCSTGLRVPSTSTSSAASSMVSSQISSVTSLVASSTMYSQASSMMSSVASSQASSTQSLIPLSQSSSAISSVISSQTSSSSSSAANCGDGVVNNGEQCDNGNSNSNTVANACRTNCTTARCGDNVRDSDEQCDNGTSNSNSATCLSTCVNASCGDGFVKIGTEECDDDGNTNGDGCSSSCMIESTWECNWTPSICVRAPQCRDGIDNDGDGAIDAMDFGCHPADNDESSPLSQCQDGIDNDGDGTIDYLGDVGCQSAQSNSELCWFPSVITNYMNTAGDRAELLHTSDDKFYAYQETEAGNIKVFDTDLCQTTQIAAAGNRRLKSVTVSDNGYVAYLSTNYASGQASWWPSYSIVRVRKDGSSLQNIASGIWTSGAVSMSRNGQSIVYNLRTNSATFQLHVWEAGSRSSFTNFPDYVSVHGQRFENPTSSDASLQDRFISFFADIDPETNLKVPEVPVQSSYSTSYKKGYRLIIYDRVTKIFHRVSVPTRYLDRAPHIAAINQKMVDILAGTVVIDTNRATCTDVTVPNFIEAGRTFTGTVRIKNTGTTTWTASKHQLMSQNEFGTAPSTKLLWGTTSIAVPSNTSANATATFTIQATAPLDPADLGCTDTGMGVGEFICPFSWRMRVNQSDLSDFGEICTANISVLNRLPAANCALCTTEKIEYAAILGNTCLANIDGRTISSPPNLPTAMWNRNGWKQCNLGSSLCARCGPGDCSGKPANYRCYAKKVAYQTICVAPGTQPADFVDCTNPPMVSKSIACGVCNTDYQERCAAYGYSCYAHKFDGRVSCSTPGEETSDPEGWYQCSTPSSVSNTTTPMTHWWAQLLSSLRALLIR